MIDSVSLVRGVCVCVWLFVFHVLMRCEEEEDVIHEWNMMDDLI